MTLAPTESGSRLRNCAEKRHEHDPGEDGKSAANPEKHGEGSDRNPDAFQ